MRLGLQYRAQANPYPGAFLSNPAMLLDTQSQSEWGPSFGGHGAGCFFAYAHYHEDTLGPALLLGAFSPRTQAAARPLKLYAQAMMLLAQQGFAQASMSAGSCEGLSIEDFAQGLGAKSAYASMSLAFDAPFLSKLDHLRTDTAMEAVKLALEDQERGPMGGSLPLQQIGGFPLLAFLAGGL